MSNENQEIQELPWGRFKQMPIALMRSKKFSPQEKLLLSVIIDRCGIQSFCYPSNWRLADDTGMSKGQINDWLKKLKDKGVIKTEIFRGEDNQIERRYIYLHRKQLARILEVGMPKNQEPLSGKFDKGMPKNQEEELTQRTNQVELTKRTPKKVKSDFSFDNSIPNSTYEEILTRKDLADGDEIWLKRMTESMADHYLAKGEKKFNWAATLRNWCRRSIGYGDKPNQGNKPKYQKQTNYQRNMKTLKESAKELLNGSSPMEGLPCLD